ncbi:hypothetical protein [Colwellia sp. RSH04]|uniref:hypothetical protein n=1 Tax=Colwellia sp. RSH04 TaxID=2305464 RepID=UPI000E574CA3|nr:hypothetical protein [Colwellia sp. RSH04]RHW75010.1 hypothetical protein D1094_15385 [Colwellia sp. RSH04]
MTNTNSPLSNQKNTAFLSSVIKVNSESNPDALSKKQWAMKFEDTLPGCWTLQYQTELNKRYSHYLDEIEASVQASQHDIELTDIKCERNATFSQILLTVQITPFISNIQLVLKTSDKDEVSLCSLKEIAQEFDDELNFENQKINLAQALNQRIPDFCLPAGQQLLLRISGGILLTDNILLVASYT